MKTDDKISALRKLMKKDNISAYIIPSTDPHMSEYAAGFWESRKWISGFTGSAGTVVITLEEAGLWTDGRYYLQGEQQISGSEIKLFKQGLEGVPTIDKWLTTVLKKGDIVGVDANVFSVSEYSNLESILNKKGLSINGNHDYISKIWIDRPKMPRTEAYIISDKLAGKSIKDKIKEVRKHLSKKNINSHLVASLDDIAWILNIRGADVDFNPVTISYLLIEEDKTILFIDDKKLSSKTRNILLENNVSIELYTNLHKYIESNLKATKCLIDALRVNQKVFKWIDAENDVVNNTNPSTFLKAKKNPIEIENIKNAMLKDGIAMTKFLHWIENNLKKESITEVSISKKLIELRKEQDGFVGESFSTIAGYRANGAIIHYFATPETDTVLESSSFVLVDSGAQYFDGTTDLTRTIPLGTLTQEEKKDYTLVLKGHIQLAMAIFPKGTRGYQIDILARQAMLREGLNYHHGTGHGVGFFLNVHEGPHSIRPDDNPNFIEENSIISNEPGLYRANKHGIRIENLVLTKSWKKTDFGDFLEFETLTLCPIDTRPIVKELLLEEEKEWLNNYHNKVFDKVSPHLKNEELAWLKEATKSI